jgi:cytosine/adenosine deaminase-related metal-dependent hydrolase
MSTLLVKNAAVLMTMDDHRQEISGGGFYVRDGYIVQVGESKELPNQAEDLDLSNPLFARSTTHHHFIKLNDGHP